MAKRSVDPLTVLRGFVRQHPNVAQSARALGIGHSYLSDMLKGKRGVGPKVLEKLGLEREMVVSLKRSA